MILVSRRKNGKLYVVDGWHRVVAAIFKGYTHGTVFIIEVDSVIEETNIWGAVNKIRKQPTPLEIFKNDRRGRKAYALDIHKIITDAGFNINYVKAESTSTGVKWPHLRCISTIVACHENNREMFIMTMNFISRVFKEEDNCCREFVIGGMYNFLCAHEHMSNALYEELEQKIGLKTMKEYLLIFNDMYASIKLESSSNKWSKKRTMYWVFAQAWNKKFKIDSPKRIDATICPTGSKIKIKAHINKRTKKLKVVG